MLQQSLLWLERDLTNGFRRGLGRCGLIRFGKHHLKGGYDPEMSEQEKKRRPRWLRMSDLRFLPASQASISRPVVPGNMDPMCRSVWLAGMMFVIGCTAGAPERSDTPKSPAEPPAPVAAVEPALETATFSVASFRGDDMTECATATVTKRQGRADMGVSWPGPLTLTLLLVDDALVAAGGGSAALLEEDGVAQTTAMMDRASFKAWSAKKAAEASTLPAKAAKATPKPSDAEIEKNLDEFVVEMTKQKWPTNNRAKDVKSGALAKVEDCAFPGRAVLGTCLIGNSLPVGSWSFVQRHYSVAATIDSDAAFKRCLKMHGKWTAADLDSDQVAHQRRRQHATQALQRVDEAQRQMNKARAMMGGE